MQTLKDANELLFKGSLALSRVENQGIRIDTEKLKRTKYKLSHQIIKLSKQLDETEFIAKWRKEFGAKFKLSSNDQLGVVLYNLYKLKPLKQTTTGKGSTDEETLNQIDLPELQTLLKIRKLKKIRDTYLAGYDREQVDGFIHPSFNLNTVTTYRSSSSNPNMQNVPIRDAEAMNYVRDIIFPRKGCQLLEADFSKLEVSIAACYHKDPVMLKYLTSDKNDMHADLAEEIFFIKYNPEKHKLLRNAAKNGFIFPQFYGDYYKGNAESLRQWVKLSAGRWSPGQGIEFENHYISDHLIKQGIRSLKHFENHLRKVESHFWNERFKVYKKWKDLWIAKYEKKGYLQMKTGFICKGSLRKNAIINYPVQGAAFHCLLWSLIQLDEWLITSKKQTKIIGQIHDSMIFDVSPGELEEVINKIQEVTTIDLPAAWNWIIVPLQIGIDLCSPDEPWSKKREIKI